MATRRGFTLIEVLVALAVLSIALVALLRANNTYVNQLGYLEKKTYANWVALNIVKEVREQLLTLPVNSAPLSGRMHMYRDDWGWDLYRVTNNAKGIIRFKVRVQQGEQVYAQLNVSLYVQ